MINLVFMALRLDVLLPDVRQFAETALLRSASGRRVRPGQAGRSDRPGEFGERGSNPQSRAFVDGDLVVSVAQVLDECVSGDDGLGGGVGLQSAHRSEGLLSRL